VNKHFHHLLYPVYTIQPVVKPVSQPVWHQVVSCKRGFTKPWLFVTRWGYSPVFILGILFSAWGILPQKSIPKMIGDPS